MHGDRVAGNQEDVGAAESGDVDNPADAPRCYLYLVNYARAKPEIALKALPLLLEVRETVVPARYRY